MPYGKGSRGKLRIPSRVDHEDISLHSAGLDLTQSKPELKQVGKNTALWTLRTPLHLLFIPDDVGRL